MTTILNNSYAYWALVAVFMLGIEALRRKFSATNSFRWAYFSSLVVMPGTYMHELAHATVGFVTNAKPLELSVVPLLGDTDVGGTLGLTSFGNLVWYNAVPVGLAPLLLIPFGLVASDMTTWNNPGLKVAEAYLVANMLYSSIPSDVDLSFAKKYWYGPVVIAGVFVAVCLGTLALHAKV